MTNKHFIPTPNISLDGHYKSPAVIRIAGSSRSGGPGGWAVGGWNSKGEGRTVFQGDLVQGPCAYIYGLAAVLDNSGGTRSEHGGKAAEGLLFDAADGDTLVLDGQEFVLGLSQGYPKLTPRS